MTPETTIKIRRRWNYAGALSAFTLMVDDQKIGKISNGKEESFPISAGQHSIFIQGALGVKTKKIDFHINAGETKSFECGIPISYWIFMALVMLLFTAQYMIFHSSLPVGFRIMVVTIVGFTLIISGLVVIFKQGCFYYLKEID